MAKNSLILFLILSCAKTPVVHQMDVTNNQINSFEIEVNENNCSTKAKRIGSKPFYTVTVVDGKTVVTFDKEVHGSFYLTSKDFSYGLAEARSRCENQKLNRSEVQ